SSGGLQQVDSGGFASATTIAGGTEIVSAGGSAATVTISGGLLHLKIGGLVTDEVTFAGSGGVYELEGVDPPGTTYGVISGFAPGDIIDQRAVAFDATGTATLGANNLLTVHEN